MPIHIRILALVLAPAALLAATNQEIFDQQIQPVLSQQCQPCHSASAASGGLAIIDLQSLLTGGKHGGSIVPGKASESLLIQYIKGDKAPRMPLGRTLDSALIASLTRAIDSMQPVLQSTRNPYTEWLFSKVKTPSVPAVRHDVSNPIDAFILSNVEAKGLEPAKPAPRDVLLRRVFFDLVGVPPSLAEAEAFLQDKSPEAYEKLVDRLLNDKRYGERWARHWLDLVRFAESDGFAIDGERPTAWRYRDYVIRSFNEDKPYDTFVKEQLAGDEMTDKAATPEARSSRLVALGYLRLGTWEADANFKTQLRQDFLNDITTTTSQVFLGLTAGCARCHDHKYDPIPQKDFYRLQAFFAATKPDDRNAPHLAVEDPKQMKQLMRELEDKSEETAQALKELEAKLKAQYAAAKKLDNKDKAADDFRKSLKDSRDLIFTDAERKNYATVRDASRRAADALPRYKPVAYSVSDVVPPQVPAVADTYLLAGGELSGRGEKVEPGFLTCLTGKSEAATIPFAGGSSGRRGALADWIASPENPLTARVMVNRIWQHHFGSGLVRTPNDWGLNGERPSHPELLDWMATQFVANKWSMKSIHRLILLSKTYQQSVEPAAPASKEVDPENRLLSRMNWNRLEAEALRDSVLAVSGTLQNADGGPGVFLDVPDDVAEGFEFFSWFPSEKRAQHLRTIYTFQRRSVMLPMVEVFDGANMNESCSRRSATVVPTQAFSMLNSKFINEQADAFAERVIELAGQDRAKQVDLAFRLALTRSPSGSEQQKALSTFSAFPSKQALTRLGVVLFNLNEFVYIR